VCLFGASLALFKIGIQVRSFDTINAPQTNGGDIAASNKTVDELIVDAEKIGYLFNA